MPGFIELIAQSPAQRGRRRRRRMTITTPSGVRCAFTTGIPIDLAAALFGDI